MHTRAPNQTKRIRLTAQAAAAKSWYARHSINTKQSHDNKACNFAATKFE
jgi:hypothetical protein